MTIEHDLDGLWWLLDDGGRVLDVAKSKTEIEEYLDWLGNQEEADHADQHPIP